MSRSAPTDDFRSVHEVYAEGLRYFMGQGKLNSTLAQVSADLKQHGIEYLRLCGAVEQAGHHSSQERDEG